MSTVLRELLDLPQEVIKSDFVVKLTDGVERPATLLRDYAVTPNLTFAFDQALSLVQAAVRDRTSAATYVHGSFGSGKSHFMAVLSLLLANLPEAWSQPELHALYEKHAWLRETKLLRLHLHMTGAGTLEERLFRAYVDAARALHPTAPVPPLFGDRELFDNARALRAQVGDAAFFAKLSDGSAAADDEGWGELRAADRWDAARFDAVCESEDLDRRAQLFDALVRTWLPAFVGQNQRWVDIDAGLGVISRHAKALGYGGVVVFFDELILWLTSLASDRGRLNGEVQKLAKLVEAQDLKRPVALVGFAARQRDIAEMVGHQFVGADAALLTDTLKFWEGRFETIKLEDRNLPAIIRKRVVRPRDAAAKERLEQGFRDLLRKLSQADKTTLLGDLGDENDLRTLYPFSPALVEALVAMSAFLQRDRTALKVLVELLVEHMEDFQFGRLLPVGDLYDVLAGGEEPMDGAMRVRWQDARRLYQNELLPVIQAKHGTATAQRCQRLRDEHRPELGCSNCAEAPCRGDNRLLKTLLLAALVPETPVLRGLTVSRLVQLNHGTLKEIIPGTAFQQAAGRLRDYAGQVGKVRVGDEANPLVRAVIGGIDLKPILDSASTFDTQGARKARLRQLLFQALEFRHVEASPVEHEVEWRGFTRKGLVHYGNVREMDRSQFEPSAGYDFKVVIDFPFDEPSRTPQEDEARVVELRDRGLSASTVVWLPSFFSDKVQRELGQLVVLERILEGDGWRRHLEHLRTDDQLRARDELDSMRNQKKNLVLRALDMAYGIRTPDQDTLDPSRRVERHFHVFVPESQMGMTAETQLGPALTSVIRNLLDVRYPRHPAFEHEAGVTRRRLEDALRKVQEVAAADHQRLPFDKADAKVLEVGARLGFLHLSDAVATLRSERAQRVEGELRERGVENPDVRQVRAAFDREDLAGLTPELRDFCVLAWAAVTHRELYRDDLAVKDAPTLGKVPEDLVLLRPRLPDGAAWLKALTVAGELFGVSRDGMKTCTGRSLRRFADQCEAKRKEAAAEGADRVAAALASWEPLGPGEPWPRRETAESAATLLGLMETRDPVALVEALAAFVPHTSATALARHLKGARAMLTVLEKPYLRGIFESLPLRDDGADLLDRVRAALRQDEHITSLVAQFEELATEVQKRTASVARAGAVAPPITPVAPRSGTTIGQGTARDLKQLRAQLVAMERAIEAAGPGASIEVSFAWALRRDEGAS